MKTSTAKWLGMVMLMAGIGMGGAGVRLLLRPVEYQAVTSLQLNRDITDSPAFPYSMEYDPHFLPAEFKIIRSGTILNRVAETLDLNNAWAGKHGNGTKLKTPETIQLLERMLRVRRIRNSSGIQICITSEDPVEAARLANAIADSYHDYRAEQSARLFYVPDGVNPRWYFSHHQTSVVNLYDYPQVYVEACAPPTQPFRRNQCLGIAWLECGIILSTLGVSLIVRSRSVAGIRFDMNPKLILSLALVLSGGLFGCSKTVHDVSLADINITFTRPFARPSPNCPQAALLPPSGNNQNYVAFTNIVAGQISALTVTWADPKCFNTENQARDFLRELLSSPIDASRWHVWEFAEGEPILVATVEHASGKRGKLYVWSYPGIHWAYLDKKGAWWWAMDERLQAPNLKRP
jgi:hypothetical protein